MLLVNSLKHEGAIINIVIVGCNIFVSNYITYLLVVLYLYLTTIFQYHKQQHY